MNRLIAVRTAGLCAILAAGPTFALSMNACLDSAFVHSPQIIKTTATQSSSDAAVQTARSRLLPTVSLDASAVRSYSEPSVPTQSGYGTSAQAGVTVRQTLCTFGRTLSDVRTAQFALQATAKDDSTARADLALSVKVAYLDCLLSRAVMGVNDSLLAQAQAHITQTRTLVDAGKQAAWTITKARVDSSAAVIARIKAANALDKSTAALADLCGLSSLIPLDLTDSLIVDTANSSTTPISSPGTRADSLRMCADHEAVTSARRAFFPTLSASASAGLASHDFGTFKNNWSAGITLSAPLFEGGSRAASVQSAAAHARMDESVKISNDLSRKAEVRNATLDATEARNRLEASAIQEQAAVEQLDLANARFLLGMAAPIEITDAQTGLASARITQITAVHDIAVARLKLAHAAGTILENQ